MTQGTIEMESGAEVGVATVGLRAVVAYSAILVGTGRRETQHEPAEPDVWHAQVRPCEVAVVLDGDVVATVERSPLDLYDLDVLAYAIELDLLDQTGARDLTVECVSLARGDA